MPNLGVDLGLRWNVSSRASRKETCDHSRRGVFHILFRFYAPLLPSQVSSLVAWDADVDVALTAPGAALSAEHVLARL